MNIGIHPKERGDESHFLGENVKRETWSALPEAQQAV